MSLYVYFLHFRWKVKQFIQRFVISKLVSIAHFHLILFLFLFWSMGIQANIINFIKSKAFVYLKINQSYLMAITMVIIHMRVLGNMFYLLLTEAESLNSNISEVEQWFPHGKKKRKKKTTTKKVLEVKMRSLYAKNFILYTIFVMCV